MAANVETMFSSGRQVPWHGLGEIIGDAPTSADALHYAGLDWSVVQEQVYSKDGIIIPNYFANMRDKDRSCLGMVSERYKIVQNVDAFAFTDALLGEGVKYETAGSLAGGKRVWMLAKLPQSWLLAGENVDSYLCFTNNHDGSGSVRVCITPIRVVCQNTLNLALKESQRQWSMCHKGDIDTKMQEAQRTLMNANQYMTQLGLEFEQLKQIKLTDDKVQEYINFLLPLPESEGHTKNKINNVIILRDRLSDVYHNAPDLSIVEKSAFRFINAVSDFATHSEPLRRTDSYQENLFAKTIDGNVMIDRAHMLVRAAA